MIAPKGPGHLVRRTYTEGGGVPALIALAGSFLLLDTGTWRPEWLPEAWAGGGDAYRLLFQEIYSSHPVRLKPVLARRGRCLCVASPVAVRSGRAPPRAGAPAGRAAGERAGERAGGRCVVWPAFLVICLSAPNPQLELGRA